MTPTEILLEALKRAETRADAASVYADGIRQREAIDWPSFNRIVMDRFGGESGLRRIKRVAWKIVESRP